MTTTQTGAHTDKDEPLQMVPRTQLQSELQKFSDARLSKPLSKIVIKRGVGGNDQLLVVDEEAGYGKDSMGAAVELVEQAIEAAAGRIITDLDERVVTEAEPVESEGARIPGSGEQARIEEMEAEEVLAGESSDDVTVAGWLSPRDAGGQCIEGDVAHNMAMTLHLDQVAALEQGVRKVKGRGIRVTVPSDRELRSVSKKSQNFFQILSHD